MRGSSSSVPIETPERRDDVAPGALAGRPTTAAARSSRNIVRSRLAPDDDARVQRGGERVRGERCRSDGPRRTQGRRRWRAARGSRPGTALPLGGAAARRRTSGAVDHAEQVGGAGVVESQRPGQGLDDLAGGVAVPALLQAQVVVGADAGEHRQLLAPQSGGAAHPDDPHAHRRRVDQLAPGAQVLAERARCGHVVHGSPRRRPTQPGPAGPRMSRAPRSAGLGGDSGAEPGASRREGGPPS